MMPDGKPLTRIHVMLTCWVEYCKDIHSELQQHASILQEERGSNWDARAPILRERGSGDACPGDEEADCIQHE